MEQVFRQQKGKNNLSAVNETVNGFCSHRKPSLRDFFDISKPIHLDKIVVNDERIMLGPLCFSKHCNYVSLSDGLPAKGKMLNILGNEFRPLANEPHFDVMKNGRKLATVRNALVREINTF